MDGRICFDQPPRPHFETPGHGGCTCFCCEVLEAVQWLMLLHGTVLWIHMGYCAIKAAGLMFVVCAGHGQDRYFTSRFMAWE